MCANLQAQVDKAVLSGTAMDASGAVVVGAKIQAKNVATAVSYSAVTDGQGRYTLPELPVGTYDVAAQKSGFQKVVQTGIVLTVGARPVLDFKLPVGRMEEVVEVQGQASKVDTETAAVGQLIAPKQMENLPLNGRNFSDLLSLAPGVQTVPSGGTGGGASATGYGLETNYSVSGSRPVGQAYMLDNADIRNAGDHGAGVGIIGTSLGMEAIQEFTILTNTYSAEFGGTGAAVNAVTKSGTNNLHGSAYEYIRNSALDAANYFDVPGEKPAFKRNQFGGSVGGPIKKDKTFFFVNYEGLRSGTGMTERGVVPTSLSSLFEAGGMTQNASGQWVGPYGSMSSLTQQMFSLYPLAQSSSQCPNVTNIGLLAGTGLYCSQGTNVQNEDYILGRIDYTLGPKDSLFGRYNIEHAYQSIPYVESEVPGWPEIDHEQNQYVTVEERHTFSPKMLNELRVGLVRLHMTTAIGGINGTDVLDQVAGREDMAFAPGQGLTSLGAAPSSPSMNATNRISVGDDVIMSLGAHSLRFGAVLTRVQTNSMAESYGGGWWDFLGLNGGTYGALGGSLYGSPFMLLGAAGPTYSYTTPSGASYAWNPNRYWRQNWLNPYIQDDWKISKRLTLNLGVRYEWASNPTTVGYPVFVIDNLTSSTTTENSFVTASHPFTSNPNVMNIDPRIGLAFDPFGDHKTSIRAGFGMFHEPVTARTFSASFSPDTPLFESYFPALSGLYPNLPSSLAQMQASPFCGSGGCITYYGAILSNVNTSPYAMQYNLTVQRELAAGMVLSVGYNGSSGVHMFSQYDANLPQPFSGLTAAQQAAALATGDYPSATGQGAPGTVTNPFTGSHVNSNFQAVEAEAPTSHSTYNSLQASLSRQFSRSLLGNASYTWSKCLDDGSATTSNEQGEWAVYDAYNHSLDRGPCSFNSNQVFNANAIYRLPFKGNRLVEGWQISPIVSRFTGLPINVQNMLFSYQSNIGGAVEGERPEAVPGCNAMVKKRSEWWNPACFVEMPYGTIGDAGRDSLNNPNFFNLDFSVFKDTKLTEKVTMQLRAEFFDILNHPNFNVGQQAYLMSTVSTLTPTNANYSQINNPAAYMAPNPATGNPGGAICNPSQNPNAAVVGPCYVSSTALSGTMPGSMGGQRQIQFAVKFTF
jgi:hypothetical protein